MILTDKDIRALCTNEKKSTAGMINPFFEESLQSESYDLAIGKRIAVLKKEVRCIDITIKIKLIQFTMKWSFLLVVMCYLLKNMFLYH